MGGFLAEQLLDELFLTLAPQIAGQDEQSERPALVAGQLFVPERSLWSTLISVKCGGNHLFLTLCLPDAGRQGEEHLPSSVPLASLPLDKVG